MLTHFPFEQPISKQAYQEQARKLKHALAQMQQKIKEKKLSVLILFEGFSAAGKGNCMSQTILALDPRFFKTYSILPPNQVERRYPDMRRFWEMLPRKGQMVLLDRSWYHELIDHMACSDNITAEEIHQRLEQIERFERQITDDKTLLIKFFIHISRQEQKKRLQKLSAKESTSWRVTPRDWECNKHYADHLASADLALKSTDFPFARWHVIDGTYRRNRNLTIYRTILNEVQNALGSLEVPTPPLKHSSNLGSSGFALQKQKKLSEINLQKSFDPFAYHETCKRLQKSLRKLQNEMYLKKIPAILVFEGWDAAGKGGAIKRVSAALDARGYTVNPIASPTETELAHHYLWRFWNTLPKTGHIAIYDRSWYGRVMVERVENITPRQDWQRAYREINEFEYDLHLWGAAIIKFWLHIDPDVQLERFNKRQSIPEKRWKITDEDWRNREKWSEYEKAVDQMIALTSTEFAPWTIVEANDKLYARIKVLQTLEHALRKHLRQG